MGCLLTKKETKEESLYYCDCTGKLVTYHPVKIHSRKDEQSYVNTEEAYPFQPNEECYLIYTPWLDQWFAYCSWNKTLKEPQPKKPKHITNYHLVDQVTGLLKPSFQLKKDFRPIKKKVWEYLFSIYGGGPVIYFFVPVGLEEKAYKKGTWVKHVNFQDVVKLIYPSNQAPKILTPSEPRESATNPLVTMAIYSMQQDVGASKIKQAKEVQKEINQAVAESAGAVFAKELGRQKFVEAEKLNQNVKQENTQAIASIFVDDMAESKKKQANEKKKEELLAQEERIMESLKGAGAKQRFRIYLKSGKTKEAEIEAAKMLQGAWRGKLARRKMEKKRLEKNRLREESAAIKLQGRWRIKKSKEKVRKLREEQRRLREQGAAIMLQSAWRIKKAREKVTRLKLEKQRLLEEGSALMLQAAWRRKHAMKKVSILREEKKKEDQARRKLGHFALRYIAKLKYLRKKRQAIHILAVTLISAQELNIADTTGSSDPYVTIQGWHSQVASSSSSSSSATISTSNPMAKSGGDARKVSTIATATTAATASSTKSIRSLFNGTSKPVCSYKSQVVYKNLNPVWNETCMIPNINGYDDLVLTVADHDIVTAHDFLGQAIIHLADYDKIFAGKEVKFTLPLQSYMIPIKDIHNKDMNLGDTSATVKGTITLSIYLPSSTYVHAGAINKLSKGAMGLGLGADYKPRYMILTRERLTYYPDSFSLDSKPRGIFECEHITIIEIVTDKSGSYHVHIATAKEHWEVKFVEEPGINMETIKETWLRKLHNCCRNVSKPSVSAPKGSNPVPSSPAAKTPSKRAFMFGGR